MANNISLMAIQKKMQSIISANDDIIAMKADVVVEPDKFGSNMPFVSINRENASFEITTVNRSFRVEPVVSITCADIDYQSNVDVIDRVDTIVEKVLRIVVNNQTWDGLVLTSQPDGAIDYVSGRFEGLTNKPYMAMATIPIRLMISYT
jgi:hypothetical protein